MVRGTLRRAKVPEENSPILYFGPSVGRVRIRPQISDALHWPLKSSKVTRQFGA